MRLYDSREQAVRDFTPAVPGRVGIYVCGPTVQSEPHIGHLRSALVYDQLRRWFEYRGDAVTLIRNVTDIDDKVLQNATADESWFELAYRMELAFSEGYRLIGVRPPSYEPRATANIPQMHVLISELIERGHAYAAADDSGDVYFDVRSWPHYGALTRQTLDNMEDAADADPRAKRDPRDFALWKGAKPGEPSSAVWDSPWGPGRPGWHIECSAMASRYLGESFDIHGGGLDLRFPHHENELAQSTAAGHGFARFWVHNGLVNVDGQKMSKSLGNSVYAAALLAAAPPLVVRYALGQAHYRSTIDFHAGSLDEAEAALGRIESFLDRAREDLGRARAEDPLVQRVFARLDGDAGLVLEVPAEFAAALDDDLALPQALAVLHTAVRHGNSALGAGDHEAAARYLAEVVAMVDVLGINPRAPEWAAPAAAGASTAATAALDTLVGRLLAEREAARAARDFAAADRIRTDLAEAGITIDDTPQGANWSIDG